MNNDSITTHPNTDPTQRQERIVMNMNGDMSTSGDQYHLAFGLIPFTIPGGSQQSQGPAQTNRLEIITLPQTPQLEAEGTSLQQPRTTADDEPYTNITMPPHYKLPGFNCLACKAVLLPPDETVLFKTMAEQQQLVCVPCGRAFSESSALVLHNQRAKRNGLGHSPTHCVDCNVVFANGQLRDGHCRFDLTHKRQCPDIWDCQRCGSYHRLPLPPATQAVCAGCDRGFYDERSWKQHQCGSPSVFSVTSPLICRECMMVFGSYEQWISHSNSRCAGGFSLRHTRKPSSIPRKWICPECGIDFGSGKRLQMHSEYQMEKQNHIQGRIKEIMWEVIPSEQRDAYWSYMRAMLHTVHELKAAGYVTAPLNSVRIHAERRCINCYRKGNDVNRSKGQCTFHRGHLILPGKLPEANPFLKSSDKAYTCCPAGAPACTRAVAHNLEEFAVAENEFKFLPTPPRNPNSPKHIAIVIDCEMAPSVSGRAELIQLCILDFFTGRILFCNLVKPHEPLLHLNARFSGVTEQIYSAAAMDGDLDNGWQTARERLWEFADEETIIIGHDVRNDLWQLRTIHTKILDTSLLCMTAAGDRKKLVVLAEEVAGIVIRDVKKGHGDHSVTEDALAARQVLVALVKNKMLPIVMRGRTGRFVGASVGVVATSRF